MRYKHLHSSMVRLETQDVQKSMERNQNLHSSMVRLETYILYLWIYSKKNIYIPVWLD